MIKYVRWEVDLDFFWHGEPTSVFGGIPVDEDDIKKYYADVVDAPDLAEKIIKEMAARNDAEEEESENEVEVKTERGLTGFRRDDVGPYMMDYQVKACIKQAASVAKLTTRIKGLKNQLAEGLVIYPSKLHFTRDGRIVSVPDDIGEQRGQVNVFPLGKRQIITFKEFVKGASLTFVVEYIDLGRQQIITDEVFQDIMEVAQRVGLGSVRSMDHGRFTVSRIVKSEDKEGK